MSSCEDDTSTTASNNDADNNNKPASTVVVKVKCVLVGDAEVGKTSMIRIATDSPSTSMDYEPTVIDVYGTKLSYPDAYPHIMDVYDTPGKEEYDRLRQLTYEGVNVVVICYSIASRDSFLNAKERWANEMRVVLCSQKVSLVLAATKTDIRKQPKTVDKLARATYADDQLDKFKLVTTQEGIDMASNIGAQSFAECASDDKASVLDVFRRAFCVALKKQNSIHEPMKSERKKMLRKFQEKSSCTIS